MKYVPIFAIALIVMVSPTGVLASSEVLDVACEQMIMFWTWIRTAVYVLAAIGLALISFKASLMGKFSMSSFIGWAGGLFVLAMTEPVIAFLTSGAASLSCN